MVHEAPAITEADLAPVEQTAEGAPDQTQTNEAARPEAKVDESDRVIELSRSNREHERRRKEFEGKAAAADARMKQLEPVVQLLGMAKEDPRGFLVEIADIVGLTPERALEIMATAGAGGDAALSAEDKIARLERELGELRNPRPAEQEEKPREQAQDSAKSRELDMAQATLEAAPEKFPLCGEEPAALEAAFLYRVRHWESNGRNADGTTKQGYRPVSYAQALGAIEAHLRTEIERKAGRIGLGSNAGQPANGNTSAPGGGLSNRAIGAVNPLDLDRAVDDSTLREEILREIGLSRR